MEGDRHGGHILLPNLAAFQFLLALRMSRVLVPKILPRIPNGFNRFAGKELESNQLGFVALCSGAGKSEARCGMWPITGAISSHLCFAPGTPLETPCCLGPGRQRARQRGREEGRERVTVMIRHLVGIAGIAGIVGIYPIVPSLASCGNELLVQGSWAS